MKAAAKVKYAAIASVAGALIVAGGSTMDAESKRERPDVQAGGVETGASFITINGTTITFPPSGNQQTDAFPGRTGPGAGNNTATGSRAVVGGGSSNDAYGYGGTVSGGTGNTTHVGYDNTVGGGFGNTAGTSGELYAYNTVGGGSNNTATAGSSTVGGGVLNAASAFAATVPGGAFNLASGSVSAAMGFDANATHNYSFVWGDSGGGGSYGANTFNIHASGGIYFNGVLLHASDRDKKEDFREVDAAQILEKVMQVPIQSWRFKAEDETVRHIGPMSQDFVGTFGYGTNDRFISSVDADGIALAAIQALETRLNEKDARIRALEDAVAELQARMSEAKTE